MGNVNILYKASLRLKMRLSCELEVVYALTASKTTRSKASISLGKKAQGGGTNAAKQDELFLVVSTAKNVSGSKYKVSN